MTKKGMIDTYFARTLLILVGAVVIFAFWFYHQKGEVYNVPQYAIPQPAMEKADTMMDDALADEKMEEDTTAEPVTAEEALDPVLGDLATEDLSDEALVELDDLDTLFDEEDLNFEDLLL